MKSDAPGMRCGLVCAMAVALAIGSDAFAGGKKKPGGGLNQCPRVGVNCLDVWNPVICDDGQVYSNSCHAWVACAEGCEPYGGDTEVVAGKKKPGGGGLDQCPRVGVACLDVWDPVICDDGQVYSNGCYAWIACAEGCEPYGDTYLAGADKKKPGGGLDQCPRIGIACLDVWDPVICDDGQVYSNSCYAYVACAEGCVPDGDTFLAGADKANCDRPKFCPELWAPVICDDGKIYPNDCYAQKKCATGCEPYGDLLLGGKKKPGPDPDACPRIGWACPDVWDPVICDDGQVYSNGCYAWIACAEGCEPYGDGGPIELE